MPPVDLHRWAAAAKAAVHVGVVRAARGPSQGAPQVRRSTVPLRIGDIPVHCAFGRRGETIEGSPAGALSSGVHIDGADADQTSLGEKGLLLLDVPVGGGHFMGLQIGLWEV